MKRSPQVIVALFLATILGSIFPAAASAQGVTTSAITGRVVSDQGQPLPGVQIVVTNTATGAVSGVLTRQDGRYLVAGLLPGGPYTIQAQGLGYATQVRTDVPLFLGQTAEYDFVLATEAIALEGLEVTAARTDVFSPSKTGASTVITEDALEDLPTLTRNFTDIAALSPFVYTTGEQPSVGGQNNRFNNIQIDGAVNNDVFGLASSGVPGGQANAKPISMDAIAQFQVLIAPFDVRQSGFTGGLINAVTKSGTNEFHGSLFGQYRDLGFINEQLVVDLPSLGGGLVDTLTAGEFENQQFGFTLGGPIIKDRLHFFTAAEWERRSIPEIFGFQSDPGDIRVVADSVQRFMNLLEGYGVEPGSALPFALDNPADNIFARLDFQLNQDHRMTLRHNYAAASDDDDPSRGGSTFELSSATYQFNSETNSTVFEVISQLSQSLNNELLFNYQTVRDRRTPPGQFQYPSVDVSNESEIAGDTVSVTLRAGAELFSHANELDQDIIQVTDNLTAIVGAHQITVGAQGEYYDFRNLFAPSTLGAYEFDSLEDFAANRPSQFAIAVPAPGVSEDDIAARFAVFQASAYAQDNWTISDALRVNVGLRVDMPFMLDDPLFNQQFQDVFGFSNARVPSGNAMLSPRIGFNWSPATEVRTQLRGGVGLFTGRPPFVWLSNVYGNTGRGTVTLNCFGGNAPGFAAVAPRQCLDGTTAASGGIAIINTVSEDFRFPQELKLSLGLDRELPLGFTASVEALYTKAVNQVFSEELNLAGVQGTGPASIGGRPVFGRPVDESFAAFQPVRVSNEFGQVVNLTNTDEPYSYMFSVELMRRFFDALDVRGSYAFLRSYDTQTSGSSQATSNIGFNPVAGDPNTPELTRSNFDRPHKVVLSASLDELWPRFGGTNVSLFYIGQSGKPYSYLYDGDVNGDGYETFPTVNNRNNDLFYVPGDVSELRFRRADDARLLQELIELEPCLQEQRGEIMERNSCRAPWTNELNLSLEQGIPFRRAGDLKFQLDIFNVLNLLNEDWGLQRAPAFNTVDILQLRGRDGRNDPNGELLFDYDVRTERGEDGQLHATLPYDTFFSSRYVLRAGLRYSF